MPRHRPITKMGFLSKKPFKRFCAPNTRVRRGSLKVVEPDIKSDEKERLFICQGGFLRYFKREGDDMPRGQLCLAARPTILKPRVDLGSASP